MTESISIPVDAESARPDLSSVIAAADPGVRALILGSCRAALDLVHAYLPATETVEAMLPTTASVTAKQTLCLMILTDRRLLFVAPAPQVVAWPLATVEHFQFVPNSAVHITANEGKFMMGADNTTTTAGKNFEALVKHRAAVAVLRGV